MTYYTNLIDAVRDQGHGNKWLLDLGSENINKRYFVTDNQQEVQRLRPQVSEATWESLDYREAGAYATFKITGGGNYNTPDYELPDQDYIGYSWDDIQQQAISQAKLIKEKWNCLWVCVYPTGVRSEVRFIINSNTETETTARNAKKIFGIGLNRTGTSTLGSCFQLLHLNVMDASNELTRQVVAGNYAPALACTRYFETFEDFPWPLMYHQLDQQYPQAKFILTVRRDAMTWVKSQINHMRQDEGNITQNQNISKRWQPLLGQMNEHIYGYPSPVGREQEFINFYQQHNQAVRTYFHDRPDKLLEICWETGDGWPELCNFLKVPVPNIPLPHIGKSTP